MSSLHDLGKMIQELVVHELDVITDSHWFAELVEEKVQGMGFIFDELVEEKVQEAIERRESNG